MKREKTDVVCVCEGAIVVWKDTFLYRANDDDIVEAIRMEAGDEDREAKILDVVPDRHTAGGCPSNNELATFMREHADGLRSIAELIEQGSPRYEIIHTPGDIYIQT
jgi:hypothetical protein